MDEKSKYEMVWRDCARYGKDWTNHGLARTVKRELRRIKKGESVIDFGCGNGTSLQYMLSQGWRPRGIEIAANAVQQCANLVTIADLRDWPEHPVADWGLCTDVMEHIVTEDVPLTLAYISDHVEHGCFFGIAKDKDLDGEALGVELHLTVMDDDWWLAALAPHFARIEIVRSRPKGTMLWALK